MTDERIEKLARAIFALRWRRFPIWEHANDMAQGEALADAKRALAAIDDDPEAYGYRKAETFRETREIGDRGIPTHSAWDLT